MADRAHLASLVIDGHSEGSRLTARDCRGSSAGYVAAQPGGLTQVLGYATYLRRLDADGLHTVLLGYLNKHGYASIAHAAKVAAQADPGFDDEAFHTGFADALADGNTITPYGTVANLESTAWLVRLG